MVKADALEKTLADWGRVLEQKESVNIRINPKEIKERLKQRYREMNPDPKKGWLVMPMTTGGLVPEYDAVACLAAEEIRQEFKEQKGCDRLVWERDRKQGCWIFKEE